MQRSSQSRFFSEEQSPCEQWHSFAPTQLLAVSGPFHYWGPVVDGRSLPEAPARALRRAPRAKADLLLGGSQDDGLISRARAVKVGGAWGPRGPCRDAAWLRSSRSDLVKSPCLPCSFAEQPLTQSLCVKAP